jgi:hypothetical protein
MPDAPAAPPPRPRAEVEAEIARLAHLLGDCTGDRAGIALPRVEVDDAGYHVVVHASGREALRDSTTDLDELLYWVFAGVTHQLAFAHAQAQATDGQDPRRAAFVRQLELLARLGPDMAARRAAEIHRILESAPYRDRPAVP